MQRISKPEGGIELTSSPDCRNRHGVLLFEDIVLTHLEDLVAMMAFNLDGGANGTP